MLESLTQYVKNQMFNISINYANEGTGSVPLFPLPHWSEYMFPLSEPYSPEWHRVRQFGAAQLIKNQSNSVNFETILAFFLLILFSSKKPSTSS